ncbi:amino acid transporter AAT family [Fusarium heterosporum]|uniref:Amino acid transporter AAT family n=1 Tax=Fusarium heterosporum TaxID=42747 RepID=A0A8H5SRY9_FUSHE|nr:amino acid transporter AAT family [Fusarium heterosporum]
MEPRQDVVRAHSSDQYCPPLSQTGRPSAGPGNTHLQRPRRSNSAKARPSSRSGAQVHQDDTSTATQEVIVAKSKLSPRSLVAAIKKQMSPVNDGRYKGTLSEPTTSSQASMVAFKHNGPRGHRTMNYHASLPTLPTLKEPKTMSHSQTGRAQEHNPHHIPCPESDSPAQPTIQEVNESAVYPLPVSHVRNVKELPPTPGTDEPTTLPVHDTPNSPAQNGEFNKVLDDQYRIIDDLKIARDSLAAQLEDEHNKHLSELQALNHEISKWKARAADAASKSAGVQAQTPLSRPESELIKDWQNLDFDVRNFVSNHFGNASTNKIISWTKVKGDFLRDVAQSSHQVVTNKRSGLALIEATIWAALIKLVFGGVTPDGSMCWAGSGKVQKMHNDPFRLEDDQFCPLFHQWGALAANIISAAQTTEQRDQEVDYVTEEVEDLLAPCRSRMSSSSIYRRELQALIKKSIDVDLRLSDSDRRSTVL